MNIRVSVTPGAKKQSFTKHEDDKGVFFRARIKARPEAGRANKELADLIADNFQVPKSAIKIKAGVSSRFKLVQIKGI